MTEDDSLNSPFDDLLGTELQEASAQRVRAALKVQPSHHQPTGVVHGGVYATLAETVASVGATLALDAETTAVGVTNQTDFLRFVRDGLLTAEATPLKVGAALQLWQVAIRDADDRLVAHSKIKLMNVTEQRARGEG